MRRVPLGLTLGVMASCAYAQAPSPADVGISKGNPDTFKLLNSGKTWVPFGTNAPGSNIFVPSTNGNIAPNDCLKWGPGITSAGMACGSGGGGGGGSNQLTIYTSHSGLVNNVTTPTEAWTVTQQGFYAPRDGGEASYNWSFTSYCPGGTSGAPALANGYSCVLPIGQSPTVAGRYLLNLSNGAFNVRQFGMKPSADLSFDNSPFVAAIMAVIGSPYPNGPDVIIPGDLGVSIHPIILANRLK